MEEHSPRKLAVILHADVVSSTRLVHRNETLAHERIQDAFSRFSKTIEVYGGIPQELRGDALVAEFYRASDAVAAALAFQAENTQFNSTLEDDIQPHLRMGIAMGEVVVADDTITGDGVVLAQRLEQLAKSGGLVIQGAAHETVPWRLPFAYERLGEQEVKGFDEPVQAYAVTLKPGHAIPLPERHARRRSKWVAVAAIGLLFIIGGGLVWFQPWVAKEEPASIDRMAFPLPDKPSIAVLPFDNLSGEPEQDYFVDGITDTLITILSRLPNLFVIARNSTFTYRGKPVKVQQVAENLGVRYVLEGSVQRFGGDVRINAQLIDALSGRHVWAEQYDREVDDIFALQDDIARNVATAMEVKLTEGEQARTWRSQTKSADAYDIYARGIQLSRRFTPADNAEAQRAFQKVVALDPEFAAGWVMLAWTFFYDGRFGWSDDSAASWERAKKLAAQALALDESNADAYELLASVAMHVERNYDKAITYCEKAISLNPGADVLAGCAGKLNYAGRPDKALPLVERAMRLSPHYPAWYLLNLGNAHRLMRNYEQALPALEAWRDRNPENTGPHIVLAYTYAEMGRIEDAQAEAEEILKRNPEFSLEQQAKQTPYKDPRELQRTLDGLRAAGIPERPPLPLPDNPSIAVLSFENLSGDPEQEYFSDGLTEDIITNLSRFPDLFVIARTSTATYKGKPVKVQQVGEELGVRYVVEGSVQKSKDRVRISAQLIDAISGRHLWAGRYEGELSDIFALQDEITEKIVATLFVKIDLAARERLKYKTTENVEAYDLWLLARDIWHKWGKENNDEAGRLREKAIALDPEYARAYADLAWVHVHDFLYYGGPKESLDRALELAQKAVALDDTDYWNYWALGYASLHKRLYDQALASYERGLALNPNNADYLAEMADALIHLGRPQDAIAQMKRAMRLNPFQADWYPWSLGLAYYQTKQYEEAIATLKSVNHLQWPSIYRGLAATYAQLGRLEEARAQAGELLKLAPDFSIATFAETQSYKNPADLEHYIEGLRKAGLPE